MRILRILLVATYSFTIISPAFPQMMTPAQMREHRAQSYRQNMSSGERLMNADKFDQAARDFEEARNKADTPEQEFKAITSAAIAYKKRGDKAVEAGESPDNIHYRSAKGLAKEALDMDPSNSELRAFFAEIPSFNNRREQAGARKEWEKQDNARREERARIEEEKRRQREASGEGKMDTALAIAGTALLVYLGAKAVGSLGKALTPSEDPAPSSKRFACAVTCTNPTHSVSVPVVARTANEAALVVTEYTHRVCVFQGSSEDLSHMPSSGSCLAR